MDSDWVVVRHIMSSGCGLIVWPDLLGSSPPDSDGICSSSDGNVFLVSSHSRADDAEVETVWSEVVGAEAAIVLYVTPGYEDDMSGFVGIDER